MSQVNRDRQTVTKEVDTLSIEYCSVNDALQDLQRILNTYGPTARIRPEYYAYSNSDARYLAVIVDVPETDEQMEARIKIEEKRQAEQEEQERKTFERLRLKFEN